ncbi:prion-like-(Q/N-rich) domain-bearing protein 25 [Ostrea edulis]|uniref:prion-like-(Q/N-rich) domain-bearing protein 25 n=1 Tax=Ostrea edulis TaxID=37623 RepID=UPI0024AE970D|nr:prion-like-(Q/N-rich) domain-bearing protein 25 [Ostrea edulis]
MLMLLINLLFSWLLLSQKYTVAESIKRNVTQTNARSVFETFHCAWNILSNLDNYLPESWSQAVGCYVTINYLRPYTEERHSLSMYLYSGSQSLTIYRSVKLCQLDQTTVKMHFSCRISQTARIDEWCFSNKDCLSRHSVCSVRNIYGQCTCQDGTVIDRGKCLKRLGLGKQCERNEECGVYNVHCKNNTCQCRSGHYEFDGSCIRESVSFRSSCQTNRQCKWFGGTCDNGGCGCPYGHDHWNNTCIKENITFGSPCLTNRQCRAFRGTCQNGQCRCPYEYFLLNNRCTVGYKTLGSSCLYRQQCTGTPNASLCLGNVYYGKCSCNIGFVELNRSCIENVSYGQKCLTSSHCQSFGGTCQHDQCLCPYGHFLLHSTCVKENVSYGQQCLTISQCQAFGGTCQRQQCRCPYEHFLLHGTCVKGNIKLGSPCRYRQQCTGTPNASLCLGNSSHGKCSCNIGFVELNRSCIENVSHGQKCLTSSQCQSFGGTCQHDQCLCPYGDIFLHGTCVKGYIKLGSSCLYRQQCTGTPNASVCLGNSYHGNCSCNIGFLELNRSCIEIPKNTAEKMETSNSVALALGFSVGGLVIGAAFTILLCVIYNMRQMRKTRNQGAYELREMRNVHCSTAIYNEFPEDHNGELEVEENEDVDSTLGSPCIESVQNEIYNHLNEEDEDQDDMENKYDYVEPVQSTPRQFLNDDVYMAATFPQNPCLYELQRVLKKSTSTE